MKIAAAFRVKNEARWIAKVIESVRPLCDPILVFDDHSTDGTAEICEALGAAVHRSCFNGLDEARDKDVLARMARSACVDWCLMLDGDELLAPEAPPIIRKSIASGALALQFQVLYLWDRPDQIRTDGVYSRLWRASAWKSAPGQKFMRTGFGGNMHCSSVPADLVHRAARCEAKIFHLGYMLRADRIRKYRWYNTVDPRNYAEDEYKHVVQGDLPEVSALMRLKHAGPLRLGEVA